ncbi:hypothetical protein E4T43_07745 [Aureobasidium subglaciale]|nr:hypothetical protein E4T43_07745 [Aureobasidium subglaciale]
MGPAKSADCSTGPACMLKRLSGSHGLVSSMYVSLSLSPLMHEHRIRNAQGAHRQLFAISSVYAYVSDSSYRQDAHKTILETRLLGARPNRDFLHNHACHTASQVVLDSAIDMQNPSHLQFMQDAGHSLQAVGLQGAQSAVDSIAKGPTEIHVARSHLSAPEEQSRRPEGARRGLKISRCQPAPF